MSRFALNKDSKGNFYASVPPGRESKKLSVTAAGAGTVTIPSWAKRCIVQIQGAKNLSIGWATQTAPTTTLSDADGCLYTGGTRDIPINNNYFDSTLYYYAHEALYFYVNFFED